MSTALSSLRRGLRAATPALALGTAALTAVLAACSDSPTGPTAPTVASAMISTTGTRPLHSATLAQVTVGDTTVTTFVLGANSANNAAYNLGNSSSISFPFALNSVCDPVTSGYGPGTWDAPCTPASSPITITAKTWVDHTTGKTRSDFKPALRFVPGLSASVKLYLKDPTYTAADQIWYCPDSGPCVNDARTDPGLGTFYSSGNKWVYRAIQHFSGYSVLVN